MKKALIALIIVLIIIQFIPLNRDNPASNPTSEIKLKPEVKPIIEKACYDCHSNNTNWPWYSFVAPVSFFVVNHVQEGRDELNFSIWQEYSQKRKSRKLKELVEEVEEGEMPLPPYIITHSEADLTEEEIGTLIKWAKSDSLYISN
ncbi:MAG: heme-binding protein [Calditrichaeota bacterium]|nr:MAG: heme-binding protein [Calditrichota bacterium]MBL1207354.1 heme-binding protein [Calditrichota bacterium]NOG47186.1 heme-binding domain-containing protein [Calditrichota bacterium]